MNAHSDERGDCTVTQLYDHGTDTYRLRIDQADKHITIADQMLAELTEQGLAGEGLFRIEAENGTVTYALRGRSAHYPDAWDAERRTPWPPAGAP